MLYEKLSEDQKNYYREAARARYHAMPMEKRREIAKKKREKEKLHTATSTRNNSNQFETITNKKNLIKDTIALKGVWYIDETRRRA